MKWTVMLVMAGVTIGAVTLRPRCATPVISTAAAARVTTTATATESVPEPVAIASFAMPAASAPGRNVFAFARVAEERRSRVSPPPPEGQARVPVLQNEEQTVVRPPDPPPAYNYLGSFGPQETPILVYKGKGEVVNVPLRKP